MDQIFLTRPNPQMNWPNPTRDTRPRINMKLCTKPSPTNLGYAWLLVLPSAAVSFSLSIKWLFTSPYPSFQMVPVWIIFSDLFKVTMIQRQITWRPINGRAKKVVWSIKRRHFQWPWATLTPSFKVTPLFDAEYLRNSTTYRQIQWNTNSD